MPVPPPSAHSALGLERPPDSASHAVCVYAEPLVAGRRVIVVGDARVGLGERLLDLGARSVHLYDPEGDEGGGGELVRGLVVRRLPQGAFDVREGSFDVAIVSDLGLIASERENLLLRLRRVLTRQGVALIGARTAHAPRSPAKALDYYELYDLVALQFPCVRMIAEVPFRGVALADLGVGEEAPEVSVDTQLAGEADPPESFIALASQQEVRLAEYAIIQLPSSGAELAEEYDAGPASEADAARRAALAQAQLRASLLEAQVDELRSKLARHAEGADQSRRAAELEAREAGAELSRERDRATALEGALTGAEVALIALRQRLAEVEERLAQREAEQQAAMIELERLRLTVASVGEAELVRFAAVEARAASLDLAVARSADEHAAELAELERALQERARVILDLEQEVARREGLVRELLGSLEDARSATGGDVVAEAGAPARDLELVKLDLLAQRRDLEARDASLRAANDRAAALATANDELRARLDGLAMEVARRESEKQEIVWRVGELEQQLSRLEAEQTELTVTLRPPPMSRPRTEGAVAPPSSPGKDGQAQRVAELEEEIDVLRQAMAQEHDARLRAESGDELTKARGELARQAVLLEQLSRELTESQGRATTEA
jgi:chromosome segregation ATPase